MVELIDLSGNIEEGQPVFPGHVDTVFWVTETHESSGFRMEKVAGKKTDRVKQKLKAREMPGSLQQKRGLMLGEHGPTHVDALVHIAPEYGDETIDRMDLHWFYGDAVGVDVSHVSPDEFIEKDDIQRELEENSLELREDDIITLHTGHYERNYSVDDLEKKHRYMREYTGLGEEAAYWLGDVGVKNIGIDAPSIDHSDSQQTMEYPAHLMCGEYEVTNMENMANLDAVAGMRYTLAAFPLKLVGGTGSPIRPVAIIED